MRIEFLLGAMNDEEKSIYNYYIGKGEVEKANEYLNNLSDVLRYSMNREFVAVITVEQHTGNVDSFELYDVAHAVSGRQKMVAKLTQSHREFTLSRLP